MLRIPIRQSVFHGEYPSFLLWLTFFQGDQYIWKVSPRKVEDPQKGQFFCFPLNTIFSEMIRYFNFFGGFSTSNESGYLFDLSWFSIFVAYL